MWNAIQCAVQGRGHVKTDTPCQDKTYAMNKNGVNVIALADGAGSAAMSHFGAEYVTKCICEQLTEEFQIYFSEEDGVAIKRKIINDLVGGLEKLSTDLKCEKKDLASTLLVAAVCDGKYILIHIGDGVIGYLKESEIKIASHPENGEFVNTTIFVTSSDALQAMKIMKGQLGTINGFVLMSDGTETSLYSKKDKMLAPILKKLMILSQSMERECLEKEIRKSFENIIKQATTDDCSIAMLVEEDYSFLGYNHLQKKEKEAFLGINNGTLTNKRCKRYDEILSFLVIPKTLDQVSKKIHLKKKHCNKHLEFLLKRNLVLKNNGIYQTSIIMEKNS